MSNWYTNDFQDLYPISSYLTKSNVSDLRLHTISQTVMITNSFEIAHNPKCQQLSLYKTSLSRLIRQYDREYLKKQNALVTIYWYVEKIHLILSHVRLWCL
jgi:hypothetical protein